MPNPINNKGPKQWRVDSRHYIPGLTPAAEAALGVTAEEFRNGRPSPVHRVSPRERQLREEFRENRANLDSNDAIRVAPGRSGSLLTDALHVIGYPESREETEVKSKLIAEMKALLPDGVLSKDAKGAHVDQRMLRALICGDIVFLATDLPRIRGAAPAIVATLDRLVAQYSVEELTAAKNWLQAV